MNTIPNLQLDVHTIPDREALSAAIEYLTSLGFTARIRKVTLEVCRTHGVVAVEVQSGDQRLPWSAGPLLAPVGFNYRLDERGAGSVTLFSGWTERELDAFVASLGAFAFGLADARSFSGGPAHEQWNPHQLPAAELAKIREHVAQIAHFAWPRPDTLSALFPGLPGAPLHSPPSEKPTQAQELEAA